jgi:hypothetical protein
MAVPQLTGTQAVAAALASTCAAHVKGEDMFDNHGWIDEATFVKWAVSDGVDEATAAAFVREFSSGGDRLSYNQCNDFCGLNYAVENVDKIVAWLEKPGTKSAAKE